MLSLIAAFALVFAAAPDSAVRDRAVSPPLEPRSMASPVELPSYWHTRAERTDFRETSTYDETVEFVRRLEAASPLVHVRTYGRSPQGRELVLVVAAKGRAFTPEVASASGKPVVLVQCCIHPGESEGRDAALALLRDIAITGRQADLLNGCVLLVVPIFNVDGHERRGRYNRINQNGPEEMGWRTTATGLNLNRDYMKAEAPEMRAFLSGVFTRWWPHLLVDTHTTDGADCRYDLTYDYNHGPEDPDSLTRWVESALVGRALPAVESMGHVIGPYLHFRDWSDPFLGFSSRSSRPRLSTGYAPLQGRAALLIETHMLKPYDVRVRATYDALSAVLAEVNARPAALLGAVTEAETRIVARGREPDSARRRVVLASDTTSQSVMFLFKGVRPTWEASDISGARVIRYGSAPFDTLIPRFAQLQPTVIVTQPAGYLVPQEWASVIERLDVHGVRYRRFAQAWSDTVEQERILKWALADSSGPREGHLAIEAKQTEMVRRWRTCRPGDVWVPLDQRSALVAVHLLEARAPDGLAYWNAFDTALERKEYGADYVVEPLARRMMREDPALAAEFRAKLAADPAFAADPDARLEFFYRRSPWGDPEQNLIPVARAFRAPPAAVLAE